MEILFELLTVNKGREKICNKIKFISTTPLPAMPKTKSRATIS
jgi:hypothetical protein